MERKEVGGLVNNSRVPSVDFILYADNLWN